MITSFLSYIHERENIRRLKEAGAPRPWTHDEILNTYKFTNVQRKNDWTTRQFVKIYAANKKAPPSVALFMCGVYRYFGTADWAQTVGWLSGPDFQWMRKCVNDLQAAGKSAFTGAYVVTNGGRSEPKHEVVFDYLEGLWKSVLNIANRIEDTQSWKAGYLLMNRLSGFGGTGFMAKEVLQDYLLWRSATYGPLLDEYSFTPVGPGARRGLNRLNGRALAFNQPEPLWTQECARLADIVNPNWSVWFDTAESLSAHDIQFCLCEFDKYQRTLKGEGRPRSIYLPRA